MKASRKVAKICSRGHKFYKSSDSPVCPICWSGYYYRERLQHDLPRNLAASALRALLNAKITKPSQLSKFTEVEISELHGIDQMLWAYFVRHYKQRDYRLKIDF